MSSAMQRNRFPASLGGRYLLAAASLALALAGVTSGTAHAVLAAKRHVIVVTINYRLSAFGFLALPSLDAESTDDSSGDYGLMDQQAAMGWVQNNAFAFGGDPGKVTIFGESAGGASVCANMASPPALGLFSHAIAESGCIFPTPG